MRGKSRLLNAFIVFILCVTVILLPTAGHAEPTAALPSNDLRGFHLVSADEGWLQIDEDLYWTADGGGAWQKITPPETGQASIRAVSFLDAQSGWAVLTSEDGTGFPVYQLAQTTDKGATWQTLPLPLFEPGDVSALAQSVYLDFIDPTTGWLVVKRASGGSFSLGALFKTADGGRTWTRLSIPIGEPVYFINHDLGWVAGGADGSQLYRTQDGGLTWTAVDIPAPADAKFLYQLPVFKDTQAGILPVTTNTASGSQVDLYTTQDGGQTWEPSTSVTLEQTLAPGVSPALSLLDGSGWVMVDEGHQQVLHSENGIQSNLSAAGTLPAGITGLDMATPDVGWAKTTTGDCQPASGAPGGPTCTSTAELLKTIDGGKNWSPLILPEQPNDIILQSNTPAVTGQGWDTCFIPDPTQMQIWMDYSPYRFWNLYIGGSSMAACGNLTANYISQLTPQGWKFNPTWVGPQAPCWEYPYGTRISLNPATARLQGINEANAAVERAANLQLTRPDKTGAIIYYDLEAYPTSMLNCRNAVKSFMDGWVAQLHARGNQAAVYGTGCTSALSDFAANANVPDAIWAAQYYADSQFRSDATVWDISCLSNDLWANHQRLHQYAGGHNETWGAITFNIDSSVADGIVIDLNAGPHIHFTSPVDNMWLPIVSQFKVSVAPDDPNANITHIDFQWHSPDWTGSDWVSLGTDNTRGDGWSILFNTSSINTSGSGQGGAIYAWAYDSSGNRYGAGVWNLGVDRTPPNVSVTTEAMYGNSPFRDFHVRWSGTDNMPGAISYDIQYQADSSTGAWTDLVMATTGTDFRFTGQYNHKYYFRARGLDGSGNLGAYPTSNYASFTVGSQPPAHPDTFEALNDNSPATTNTISIDGPPQTHNFAVEGDQDWVKLVVPSRTAFYVQTSDTGGYADTVLYLYGADKTTLLATNDDYPGLSLSSRVFGHSSGGGTFYIKVIHWDPVACGDTTQYTLSVVHAYFTSFPTIGR